MRQLASIQKVSDLQPIPNAEAIEVASILGWKVVVKKGEFQIGDLCVYCEIDSVLPPKPEFDFLAQKKYRIRTIKLRGQISQGIAFPLNICPNGKNTYKEGQDVTELLGVVKYEIPEIQHTNPGRRKQRVGKSFPSYVPKTDEDRIQSKPGVIKEIENVPCYVTLKVDGTSGTFAHKDGKIDVCSRTISRPDPMHSTLWEKICEFFLRWRRKRKNIPESCTYWNIARKYNLIEILKKTGNIAIQGEIAGPNIQQNKLQLTEHQLFVFNIYDIDSQTYWDYEKMTNFCKENNLPTVPVLMKDVVFNDMTVERFLEMAKGEYVPGQPREGIVIRPMGERYSNTLRGRLSFKVINNDFLLKWEGKES